MKTGADGRYEFRTIRPGSYPGSRIAAHIHGTLAAPGRAPQWIEDFLFHGDPFLNPRDAERSAGRATFANVLKPERAADGILRARRDFRIQTA
jgi:protocatechuate 3,4-dioxygenase beta subunit